MGELEERGYVPILRNTLPTRPVADPPSMIATLILPFYNTPNHYRHHHPEAAVGTADAMRKNRSCRSRSHERLDHRGELVGKFEVPLAICLSIARAPTVERQVQVLLLVGAGKRYCF